jgi:coenzyme PQQ precursor peptide PqqA
MHNSITLTRHFALQTIKKLETIMLTTPAATEMRFGFEVTMCVIDN